MARQGKSSLQRFVTRFVDAKTAEAIEAHSRAWRVRCPHCGFERSIWDLGGIRYGGTGRTRMLARCPQCRRTGWHKVEKAADFPAAKRPVWSVVWLILSIVLAALILSAVLAGLILKLTGTV
jgi:predicted RNA-binding Zn-ribbon protein involved in translation (DUF1610 family)